MTTGGLDDYLGSLRQEGEAVSCGDQFSLDLSAQAAKMAQYQSQEPALWLLKGVQAAVAAGAPVVCITLGRHTMELRFKPPVDVDPLILEGESPGWSRPMRLALRAALSQMPPSFCLRWKGRRLIQVGPPAEALGGEVHLHLQRQVRPWWKLTDPELASIHHTLSQRCALCPIPVQVDGRLINLPFLEKLAALGSQASTTTFGEGALPYRWLAERIWMAPEGDAHFCLSCPVQRQGRRILLRESPVWDEDGYFDNVQSIYQHLEAEGSVQEVDTGTQVNRLLALGQLPGVLATVDCSQVLALGLVNTAVAKNALQFTKMLYLETPSQGRTTVTTRESRSKVNMATMACQRWIGLSAQASGGGGLFYVLDGVLLNALPSGGHYEGTTALVADSEVTTDLSQLNVIVDQRVEADQLWLQREEARLLESSRSAIHSASEGERLYVPMSVRTHWRKMVKGT